MPEEIAPSGMMARGKYDGKGRIHDDDGHEYGIFRWKLEIKKEWDS